MSVEARSPLRNAGDGGTGFCYEFDRALFLDVSADHGPLVVALDTNIVIDLQEHGSALLDDEPLSLHGADTARRRELESLGVLLQAWLVRDIRFVPLARSLDDSRKSMSGEQLRERAEALDGVAASLAFQTDEWEWDWREGTAWVENSSTSVSESDIPGPADRELVRAAVGIGADVFLTQDSRILRADSNAHMPVNLWPPSRLGEWLQRAGVGLLAGGVLEHDDCPWGSGWLMGDTGKYASFIEVLGRRQPRGGS